MNGTDRALDFILHTQWSTLPNAVRHQAKRCLLDSLGALIAGTQTPVAQMMAAFALEQFAGCEATILAGGQRASAVGAVLANGFAANALDIDDGYRLIKGHPGACVLPPLLALSESGADVCGESFLTAFVVGYEVGIRAGLIRHALYATYHASGSWGAIAGAAAAGKLLRLDAHTLRHALGTAEYHAPIAPMMKGIDVPSMGKDGIGWGAMVALSSLLMARRGFTGVAPLFSESPNPDWIQSLGEQYEILNLYFKPYACCRWAQPAIAAAIHIAQNHHIAACDIARIEVRTFSAAVRLSRAHPRNTEEAQYNLAYPVAAALIDGELGPRQVLPPRLADRTVLDLADRIVVVVAPEYDALFPQQAIADVELVTHDGQVFAANHAQAQWEPPNTPSDDELEQKFHWLVAPVLGAERAAHLAAAIWDFERVESVRAFIQQCVKGHHHD